MKHPKRLCEKGTDDLTEGENNEDAAKETK